MIAYLIFYAAAVVLMTFGFLIGYGAGYDRCWNEHRGIDPPATPEATT